MSVTSGVGRLPSEKSSKSSPPQSESLSQGQSKCSSHHSSCSCGNGPHCESYRRSSGGSSKALVFRFRHCNNPSIAPTTVPGKSGSTRDHDSFSDHQPWLRISPDCMGAPELEDIMVFIDQTKELQTIYDGFHSQETSSEAISELSWSSQRDHVRSHTSNQKRHQEGIPACPRRTPDDDHIGDGHQTPLSIVKTTSEISPSQQEPTSGNPPLSTRPFQLHVPCNYASTPGFNIECYQNNSLINPTTNSYHQTEYSWPVFNIEEAHLMRYFIQNLSSWFDVCDSQRHFALVVPQSAATSLPLRNAIFATSARHLSRVGDYDPSVSARYYQECLDVLIPMVEESEAIMDETILVATVVLRLLEELEAISHTESRPSGHLVGIQTLINAQSRPGLLTSSLHRAAFLVGVRQEIFVAFVAQRAPIQPACFLEHSLSPADDSTWAYRMMLHCSDVLDFTYGSHYSARNEDRTSRWSYLEQYTQQWLSKRPAFFQPMYHADSAKKELPTTIFHTETHVIADLHYRIVLILLAISNPTFSDPVSLSLFSSRSALRGLDENVRSNVRAVCGVTFAHEGFATAMIMVSAIVARCAEFFEQSRRGEQEALLDVLVRTEKRHAWPTANARRSLRETWNLDQIAGASTVE